MSMQLRRIRISSGGFVAFDETFHQGINLIEGENSSGKSTLFKLIYYALGGALQPAQWTEAALRCDRIMAEVQIGETTLTISRKIEGRATTPISVLPSTMQTALTDATLDDWKEYSYSRSENKQSFSQLLFSILKWPEAFSDQGDFITFNQLLRAHYADQDSPNTTVLKFEDQFDKPTTRESIGNFLLGSSDNRLGQKERTLREFEGEYARVSGATSAGVQLMGGEFDDLNLPALNARQSAYEQELAALENQSANLMRQALQPINKSDVDVTHLSEVTHKLSSIKRNISATSEKISQLSFEISDSDLFLSTLNNKIRYLTEAGTAATEFGAVGLDFCPACGTTVSNSLDPSHCYLCKSTMGEEPAERRFFSMINSSQSQIEQSRRIQKGRKTNLDNAILEMSTLRRDLEATASELEQQQVSVVSETQAALATTQSRIGFIKSELERLKRDHSVIQRLQSLRDRRDELNAQIVGLREEIDALRSQSSIRVANAFARVSSETLNFLRADMERQEGFHESDSVEIDYRNNRFRLSSSNSLSASSTAYMRNAIFLGEFLASFKVTAMRHLKILLLENLEDKGMEPSRYYNLHENIVRRAKELTGEWQIFIATADWSPALTDGFTRVGQRYTHDNKTLRLPPPL